MDEILKRERVDRLIEYHARDPQMPSLDEVLSAVVRATGSSQNLFQNVR